MNVRKEIEKKYDVCDDGVILTPGPYEGAKLYVPYYWKNHSTPVVGEIFKCVIQPSERATFPELEEREFVLVMKGENGKIIEIYDEEYDEL